MLLTLRYPTLLSSLFAAIISFPSKCPVGVQTIRRECQDNKNMTLDGHKRCQAGVSSWRIPHPDNRQSPKTWQTLNSLAKGERSPLAEVGIMFGLRSVRNMKDPSALTERIGLVNPGSCPGRSADTGRLRGPISVRGVLGRTCPSWPSYTVKVSSTHHRPDA